MRNLEIAVKLGYGNANFNGQREGKNLRKQFV